MAAGALRNLVQIREYSPLRTSTGAEAKTWKLYTSAWAEVKPVKAEEYFSEMSLQHKVTHRIIMRYAAGIRPDMQIVFSGRIFHIVGIRDFFERHKYLEIMAEEIRND